MNWQLITAAERTAFEDNGWLAITDAVDPARVDALVGAIDQCSPTRRENQNVADVLWRHDAFLELIDNPKVLPKVADLLGSPNIWVNHSHYNVNYPDATTSPPRYYWHRDGGGIHTDIGDVVRPAFAIKIGFYLTPVVTTAHGPTYIIPHSHQSRAPLPPPAAPPDEVEAVPILIPAGTAVLYDGRLTHSGKSINSSSSVRKAIFIQYAFRWLMPVDAMSVEPLRDRISDPIRRQLLGFTASMQNLGGIAPGRSSVYHPGPDDLPLRTALVRAYNEARMEFQPPTYAHV